MNIDASQFGQIVQIVSASFEPALQAPVTPAQAELIVAIGQLAVAADQVEHGDERTLFATLAQHVYAQADLVTTPPTYAPMRDDDQRLDQLRSHATQLHGTPAGSLAYVFAYIMTIADLELAPAEGDFIETLRDALALDTDKSDDLIAAVTGILTPAA